MKMKSAKATRIEKRLVLANLLFVLLVIGAERFPGERWWPTLLMVYSPQQIWMIPSIIIAVILLFKKKWLLSAAAALPALLILVLLIGIHLPRTPETGPSDLRVMTWNLHYGRGGPSLPELVRNIWPDIICLQEADPWAQEHLDKILDTPLFKGWDSKVCGELVILSRFPLKRIGTTHSTLWVSVDVDGEEVVVANAHLKALLTARRWQTFRPGRLRAADAMRRKQVREILDALPTVHPAVICGDLNTPPNSHIYRILTSHLKDSFSSTGRGFGLTYTRSRPLVRIDHILLTSDIRPVRCWMPKVSTSNHRPLCADVALKKRKSW